ncbi:YeiH family protein [Azospirillum thiophilum]|nr:putative sulfate exporter family transporter [Azospirillum thiophilum]
MPPDTMAAAIAAPGRYVLARFRAVLPGLALCIAVTALAFAAAWGERRLFGDSWIEALVLAILAGTAIRTAWTPSARWVPGIGFSAKFLLEIAVVLLGASVSAATILSAGPVLLLGIAGVVALALAAGYGIGRLLGLPVRMALLVACGNAICGNSAIAAVAPVIGADGDDVAASIAFTAVLGVVVVLGLPLVGMGLRLSGVQYGALAGLTVYAVPQVIAAAAPLGAAAVQVGTLVKLVRVLMLGPVCLLLSVLAPCLREDSDERAHPGYPPVHHLVPWFILGFLAMVALRSFGLVPQAALVPMEHAATLLTVVSMAALGLGVDVRTVARAGGRVTAAVVLCLLTLGALSLALIHAIGLS